MTQWVPVYRGRKQDKRKVIAYSPVDDEDYERAMQYRWRLHGDGYAVTSCRQNGERKTLLLHRLLLDAPEDMQVDHMDGDRLNNRRHSNLRLATHSQNCRNSRPKGGSSRFKGVSLRKDTGKWQAFVWVDGRNLYLGRFDDEVEAAAAYDAKAVEVYGEFACTNFPRPTD